MNVKQSNLYLLHKAVNLCNKYEEKGLRAMSYLIQKGADVDCQDYSGRTPLLMAANWSLPSAIDLLCDNHADLNIDIEKSVLHSSFNLIQVEPIFKIGIPVECTLHCSFKIKFLNGLDSHSERCFVEESHERSINSLFQDIYSKSRFKLNQSQLDFVSKCEIALKSNVSFVFSNENDFQISYAGIDNKNKILMAREYQWMYLEKQRKSNVNHQNETSDSNVPIILTMLSINDMNEICKYIL